MVDIEAQSKPQQDLEDNCCDCETKPLNSDLNLILVKNVIQNNNEDNHNSELDSGTELLLKMKARREARVKFWIVTILAFGNFCVAAGVSIQGPFFPKEAGTKK